MHCIPGCYCSGAVFIFQKHNNIGDFIFLCTTTLGAGNTGKKYMEQQTREYLKGIIFRCIAKCEKGMSAGELMKQLSVEQKELGELESCLWEMESEGLIKYDLENSLWKLA